MGHPQPRAAVSAPTLPPTSSLNTERTARLGGRINGKLEHEEIRTLMFSRSPVDPPEHGVREVNANICQQKPHRCRRAHSEESNSKRTSGTALTAPTKRPEPPLSTDTPGGPAPHGAPTQPPRGRPSHTPSHTPSRRRPLSPTSLARLMAAGAARGGARAVPSRPSRQPRGSARHGGLPDAPAEGAAAVQEVPAAPGVLVHPPVRRGGLLPRWERCRARPLCARRPRCALSSALSAGRGAAASAPGLRCGTASVRDAFCLYLPYA